MKAFSRKSSQTLNPVFAKQGNDDFVGVQAKLKMGQRGDQYEVEADNVAEKVVNKTHQPNSFFSPTVVPVQKQAEEETVQEKPIAESITPVVQLQEVEEETAQPKIQKQEEEETTQPMLQKQEEEEVQAKDEEEAVQAFIQKQEEEESVQKQEEEEIQAKSAAPKTIPKANMGKRINDQRGNGSPLPGPLKTQMEDGFGADFSNVKVHTDSESASMNKDLGAQAFTNKNDIFFGAGKFNPATKEGQTLVAHELTHTIQQGASSPAAGKEEQTEESNKNMAGPNAEENNEVATQKEGVLPEGEVTEEVDTASEETAEPNAKEGVGEEGVVEEGGDVSGKGGAGKGGGKVEPTTPRNPKEDPNFKKLEGRVDATAKSQQGHETPQASAGAAQSAAASPANERSSMAQADQVDTMDATEAGEFDAEAFKAKLMERIKGMQLPENQDEATKFDENNNIDEVNTAATQDVQNEQTAAAGPIEQTTAQEPNVDAIPERETTPLPEAPVGTAPQSVNPNKAMPPKRGNAEVNQPLQDNMSEVDQEMASNNVTDEQLEKSNEPTFKQGLEAKDKAKENTENAPAQLRKKEQGILQNAKAGAENKGQVGLNGMHQERGKILNQVNVDQGKTGKTDTSERTRIASEINKIYEKSKVDVEKILSDLDANVKALFTAGTIIAKLKFEQHVDRKMTAYKDRRYSGLIGKGRWIKDKFAGMPDEVNDFFVTGRQVYIDYMDKVITKVSQLVAEKLTAAKARVASGKKEVQNYVAELPENLQNIGKDAAEKINDKFDQLEDSVNSKQDELIDSLAEQYMEGLNAVDARIEEMKAANRGLIDAALGFINGIIDTIKKLKELINSLLAAIANVIDVIMEDPIGFAKTLFSGIGKGIDMFMANIQKHVLGGFVTWLTGAMGPVGITIPDNLFSLEGIFSLVMQVLGLSWDYMRKKAVKLMGEPVVKAMEVGFEMFQIIRTKGVLGMWEYIKESFTDLKETIIESIKQMLITQVLEAGIKWLLSLLIPGAGFIKAIMAIKDLIVFFVESAIMLIPSLIEAIKALAAGNVSGVAKAVEKGLARLVPLVIGLFAKLLGLGGLVKKVQKIIKKIRKRIDRAINKLIKKARKAFKKLVKKGKAKVKGAAAKIFSWWKHRKKFKDKNNNEHTLFFQGTGKKSTLMMKSVKKQVKKHINEHKKDPATRAKALAAEDTYNRFLQAKALAVKGGSTPAADKTRADNLLALVNELSLKLRELPGDFVPADYPTAADIVFSSNGNKPSNVKSHYLTDAVPYGSPPGSGAGVTGWQDVQGFGLTGQGPDDPWIQFHLINDHFNGQGQPNNLVPTPNSVNKAYQKFENKVHALIFKSEARGTNSNAPNDKNVVWMHVKVVYYKGDANAFAKEIQAKAGIYHYKPKGGKANLKQKWILDSKPVFTSNLEVPNPKLMAAGVNLGKSGQQHIKTFFDEKGITYSNSFINEIVNNRPYSGKADFSEKLKNALFNRKIDDNTSNATEDQIRIKANNILRYFDNKLDVKRK
ncbi:DUF4157 domain-containing protein [Sungkyunkwania multivorans]|uniref:DUF4157 domain-containing protein n=1 Tax=Sungkyunkwania multivorans TaxID=1173618 RepID=A0ABW3CVF3_9FLAO